MEAQGDISFRRGARVAHRPDARLWLLPFLCRPRHARLRSASSRVQLRLMDVARRPARNWATFFRGIPRAVHAAAIRGANQRGSIVGRFCVLSYVLRRPFLRSVHSCRVIEGSGRNWRGRATCGGTGRNGQKNKARAVALGTHVEMRCRGNQRIPCSTSGGSTLA